jgi:diguanylate cyclase (GGDEF)-like protein
LERRLVSLLSEFARTLATDFPIQSILDHLVQRIVDTLPISAAGVTLISPGTRPRYIAASDESALRFEKLQSELGEGPCMTTYRTGEAVAVPDLRLDDRFPRFRERALEEGLRAVFTFPLHHGDEQLGALDLYRTSAGPLEEDVMEAAQTLADVVAAYLLNAQAREDLLESVQRAHQSSLHDELTGLPNRRLLIQRLEHAILRGRRSEKQVAILFADLDLFKAINDTYGHHVGDELLIAVADRLTRLLRPGDTLARLAGDEFVILCEDLDEAGQVEVIARRIDTALSESFVLDDTEIKVSASVGIAFAGRGDDVPEQVLQDADTAMYLAKRAGGARHGTFDLGKKQRASHRASLNRDLRGAMARGELRTAYQPIVSSIGEQVVGMEALLRWTHPVHGAVSAETAVMLAEQSGLINGIGRWVLEQACLDRRRWRGKGAAGHEISVNVSARQLLAVDFTRSVESVLSATDTEPHAVTLELTESVFVQGKEVLAVLDDLKSLGVMLALDDFGTGYSSLGYLKKLPIDTLKIDRVFIADLDRDPVSRLIVQAIVGMAHGLGMAVVAEGVQTAAQHDEVAALGCDAYQGFYFAHPSSADDVTTTWAVAADPAASRPCNGSDTTPLAPACKLSALSDRYRLTLSEATRR